MNKKLVIVAILLGIFTSIVSFQIIRNGYYFDHEFSNFGNTANKQPCDGTNVYSDAYIGHDIGFPFSVENKTYVDACTFYEFDSPNRFSLMINTKLFTYWQYWANSFFWAIIWYGFILLLLKIKNRHANPRN